MKIGLDISAVIYGTGVSRYVKNLIIELARIDNKNDYALFGGSLRRIKELRSLISEIKNPNFSGKLFPIPSALTDFVWNKLHIIPIESLLGKLDVFHSSDWSQPPTRAFNVTTIHDLVPIKYPKLSHPKIVSAHRSRIKWVIRQVDRVIVPSKTTANDCESLGIAKDKLRIIPESSVYKRVSESEVKRIKSKYKISGKYILSIGINERKNTKNITAAYEKVKAGKNLKLVIIGHPHMTILAPRGVILTGHVSEVDMPAFYTGAEVLLYPSLYEGYGLPILDSYRCRTPVVTSNLGSMKEISQGASALVDPYDVDSISTGILKAFKDKKELVERGLKVVNNLSWEVTARKTLEVYEEFSSK